MELYTIEGFKKSDLEHHGIKGQKWGERRYQNPDGSLTQLGKQRYYSPSNLRTATLPRPKSAPVAGGGGSVEEDEYLKKLKERLANGEIDEAHYKRLVEDYRKTGRVIQDGGETIHKMYRVKHIDDYAKDAVKDAIDWVKNAAEAIGKFFKDLFGWNPTESIHDVTFTNSDGVKVTNSYKEVKSKETGNIVERRDVKTDEIIARYDPVTGEEIWRKK